jgi:hypothetical protein
MYSGDYMARIMSFVTVVLWFGNRPTMGKFILDYYNWHGIFLCSSYQYAGFVLVLETATRDIIR